MALAAATASGTVGDRCFGIKFWLTDGVDSYQCWVCRDDRFGPDYQPCVVEASNLDFELSPEWGQTSIAASDFSFTILNVPLMHARAEAHDNVWHLMSKGFTWKGQYVDVVMMALSQIGVASDAQRWRGYITGCDYHGETLTFQAIGQPYDEMEAVIPEDVITLAEYPEAPEGSIGVPKPIVYGDYDVDLHGATDGENDAYKKITELMGLSLPGRVIPAICTDTNLKDITSDMGFLVANHDLRTWPFTYSNSVFYYVPSLAQLAVMDASTFTITNSGTATLAVGRVPKFSVWMKPREEDTTTNTAANGWAWACHPLHTEYASLSAGEYLSVVVERPPDLGVIDSVKIYVMGETTGNANIYLWDIDGAATKGGATAMGATTYGSTYVIHEHTLTANLIKRVDEFPAKMALSVLNGSGVAAIRYICMVVTFAPRLEVTTRLGSGGGGYWGERVRPGSRTETFEGENFPDLTDGPNQIFIACEGMADDGAGKYTNSAGSLIDKPSTILYHLLDHYGGIGVSVSAPGDVNDATTDQAGMSAALYLGKKQTYAQLAGDLCQQGVMAIGCMPYPNMSVNVVYWGSAAADNLYATAIDFKHVLADRDFFIGHTPQTAVRNAFFIHCDYDPRSRRNRATLEYDSTDSAALTASVAAYRRKEKVINANYILVAGGDEVRDNYMGMLPEPRVVLSFSTNWTYNNLQPGHVIPIDNASWVAAGRHYPGDTGGTAGAWSAGGTTRYFWVTRVSFSDDGYMEIEASEGVW